MVITYFGDGSYRFQSGETSFLVDSQNNRLKADVYLKTLAPPGELSPKEDEIIFPGEYETKGIEIKGVSLSKESTAKFLKTIYLVQFEGVKILLLGHASEIPDTKILEQLDDPDVVVVPVAAVHSFRQKTHKSSSNRWSRR